MDYEIRPMSFAEILDTAFRLVRDEFWVLTGIGMVLYLPFEFLLSVAEDVAENPADLSQAGTVLGVLFVIALLSPVAQAAITLAMGRQFEGKPVSFVGAYRGGFASTLPLVGTYLLYFLGILLGLALLVIPGLYLLVAWMLATQVVVLEGLAGPKALSRSRELLQGHMLRGLGVFFVAGLVLLVLSTILTLLLDGVPTLGAVANALVQSVGLAFYTGVGIVLYFDLRCRKENFDVEHLAQLVEGQGRPEPIG